MRLHHNSSGKGFRRDGKMEHNDGCGGDDSPHRLNGMITRKHIDIRGNQYFKDHLSRLAGLQTRYFTNDNKDKAKVRFKWQSSFRDHLIRDEIDYLNHLNYIKKQPLKHQLPGREWYWIIEDE